MVSVVPVIARNASADQGMTDLRVAGLAAKV